MAETMTEAQSRDWQFALALSRETRADPASPYTGKYVAVLNEKVVAIANSLEDMERELRAAGIEARRAVLIEASLDYERTYMIWEMWEAKEHLAAEKVAAVISQPAGLQ